MLEVENIRYKYPGEGRGKGKNPGAIIHANFTVATGHTVALMGPSGSGKSTILNLIAGFLAPDHGDLRFDGQSLLGLKPAARPLTYLFQAHNLFPHLTVRQNIAIGLHPGMRLSAEQHAAVDQALKWVSLQELAHRNPPSLSGGQQQRTALARCLARNRPLLLLDEPFTGLDDALRSEMLSLIATLQKNHTLSVLITTHQQRDSEALAAEVVRV